MPGGIVRAMTDYAERPTSSPLFACTWSRTMDGRTALIMPDACADVLWHRDSGRLFVAGPDTRAHPYSASGPIVGVRFRPGFAPAGLGVPAVEVRDARVDLDRLWPAERVERLAEELATAADPETTLATAVAARSGPWDAAAPTLARAMRDGGRVAAVAADLGLTERQLHRRCLSAFGYGPKTLQRVLRFQRALGQARAGTPLATVAYESGYADQAHLAREVKALAGVPMTQLL